MKHHSGLSFDMPLEWANAVSSNLLIIIAYRITSHNLAVTLVNSKKGFQNHSVRMCFLGGNYEEYVTNIFAHRPVFYLMVILLF